ERQRREFQQALGVGPARLETLARATGLRCRVLDTRDDPLPVAGELLGATRTRMMPSPPAPPPASTGPVLRDIHLPPAPPWWPPAPGWWLLAALVLLGCIALAWLWRRQRRLQQRRRQWLD